MPLSLANKHDILQKYQQLEIQVHTLLTSPLYWIECSAYSFGSFNHDERIRFSL